MVSSISSGPALQLNTAGIAPQKAGGAKLDLKDIPESKVKLEAPHTVSGKGLRIDIKV